MRERFLPLLEICKLKMKPNEEISVVTTLEGILVITRLNPISNGLYCTPIPQGKEGSF